MTDTTKQAEPVARLEETSVGARVYVHGIEVAWALGCAIGTIHDEKKQKIVDAINAAAIVMNNELNIAFMDVSNEVSTATSNWPKFNSAHEGFAVLLEEVDELKAHVWTNQKRRDLPAMRKEAMQVAAMAIRFMVDVCDEETGRK